MVNESKIFHPYIMIYLPITVHTIHLQNVFKTHIFKSQHLNISISYSSLFVELIESDIWFNLVIIHQRDQINCVDTNECHSMTGVWYKWWKTISTQSTSLQTYYLMLTFSAWAFHMSDGHLNPQVTCVPHGERWILLNAPHTHMEA
jgi:hypothetical protein